MPNCSKSEWWTLRILRNAFCGMSKFQDFQNHRGISTHILSQWLSQLVGKGILLRQQAVPMKKRTF
jgi:DNA-binding HxlR family transcriptional regulator